MVRISEQSLIRVWGGVWSEQMAIDLRILINMPQRLWKL